MWVLLPAIESPPRTRGIMISLQERTSQPGMTAVPAFLHALLRQVEPYPAAVQNARWDILAFNRSYDALFGLESVPVRNRNAALLYFTDPALRDLRPDWEDGAALIVGRLRAAMTRHGSEAAWTALLARLREASPEFSRLWNRRHHSTTAACRSVSCTRWPDGCGWPASTCGPSRGRTAWSRWATPPPTSRPRPSCPGCRPFPPQAPAPRTSPARGAAAS